VAAPRISVALSTYNGERFLPAQLDSLTAQSRLPDELVVRDDGSTDASREVVEAFAARSPFPVRILPGDRNLGFAEGFLEVASHCTGDLVAFCDQDDVWLPGKLERCAEAFAAGPDVVLAIHSSRIVDERLQDTGAMFPDVRTSHVTPALSGSRWQRVRGMSMVCSARLLAIPWRVRPGSHRTEGMVNHDEWIHMLSRVVGSTAWIAEPLALYRQHGANAIGAPAARLGERVRELRRAGGRYYRRRAEQARECVEILDRLSRELDDPFLRERMTAGARSYRRFAELLDRRVVLYDARVRRPARVRALASLVAADAYRSHDGDGLGRRALVKDAAVALLGWSR
jgi:glycosyltransferase involved in cell wall biosynthesis